MEELKAMIIRALRWQRNFKVSGAARFQNTQEGCSISIAQATVTQDVTGGKLPKGEYQFQNFQMVTQNEIGWDFDHIHPQIV